MSQMAHHTSHLNQIRQSSEATPSPPKLANNLVYVAVLLLLLAVVKLSMWQGSYNLDPHHWGLMLSNAKDLVEGKIPYKEIFIQYGILTTLIHAFAYKFLGGNLQSIILISAMAYAIGIWGMYSLSNHLFEQKIISSLIVVFIIVIFHPIVIYPWSNYLAFPFIVWGLIYLINKNFSALHSFVGGFLLGLATLCREGLFLPIVFFLIFNLLIDFNLTRLGKTPFKNITFIIFLNIIGFSFPLLVFLLI